jgi:PIN domain
MRLLLDEAKLGRLHILVPSVVFQETVRRFQEEALSIQRSVARFERDFGRMGFDVGALERVKSDLEHESGLYEEYLRMILESHHSEFIDLPVIPHQKILDRIIARRKPISDDGKRGYQDTLIWETILGILQTIKERLYFITNNSSDFADSSDRTKLAPDLIADVALHAGDPEHVILFGSVREFTDQYVKPNRELPMAAESVGGMPSQQDIASLLEGFLRNYAQELIGASPDSIGRVTLPIEELAIARCDYSGLAIEEIFRISDQEIGVSCMVEFRVVLRGYIHKDIDSAVLGSWTRQAETGFAFVTVRNDASLFVDMDLTLDDAYRQVIEARPTFSWAEISEPPPSNHQDRVGGS